MRHGEGKELSHLNLFFLLTHSLILGFCSKTYLSGFKFCSFECLY